MTLINSSPLLYKLRAFLFLKLYSLTERAQGWTLSSVNVLHVNLSIPVTATFCVFLSLEQTVEYVKVLERTGAQVLTFHGRTREQRGQNTVCRLF
jgi:hypothetical protein